MIIGAELNVKLPGLDDMTPDDVKKAIDTVITDPATASAVESKTVKLEMSPDELKKHWAIQTKSWILVKSKSTSIRI